MERMHFVCVLFRDMKGRVIPPRIYFHHMHDELIPTKESRFTSAALTAELVGGGEEEELWGRKSNSKVEELL